MSDAVDPSNFDNDDNNNDNNNNNVHPEQPDAATSSSFMKLLSDTTLTRLSQTEVQDLQYAFSLLDVKGTGSISVAQLMDLLQELWSEQQQQQQAPTTTVNKDNSHTIAVTRSTSLYPHNLQHVIQQLALLPPHQDLTQQDFVQVFTLSSNPHHNNAAAATSLQSVFDLFSQGKSYINVHDLQRVATELGENLSPAELHEMMQRVVVSSSGDDLNNDNNDNDDTNQNDKNNNNDPKITLQAFCHVMNRNLLA